MDYINWDDYEFDHTWEQEGDFNWKILADNYNECYHCATTHPDIPALADLATYSVDTREGSIIHDAHSKPEQIAAGFKVASTYYFPNASMNVSYVYPLEVELAASRGLTVADRTFSSHSASSPSHRANQS
jgi:phenylpropionate dioxygenase-like ring-hydroxylating dioxygenase large terminal subunit